MIDFTEYSTNPTNKNFQRFSKNYGAKQKFSYQYELRCKEDSSTPKLIELHNINSMKKFYFTKNLVKFIGKTKPNPINDDIEINDRVIPQKKIIYSEVIVNSTFVGRQPPKKH